MSLETAWDEGTNIRTALRIAPQETRAAIIALIKDTVDFIDAKKGLRGVEDILLTAQAIEKEHPTLKLEEIRLVLQGLKTGKYGKLYERLKTPEFLEAFRKHETERAQHLERIHTRHNITRGLRPGQKINPEPIETYLDVIKRRAHHLPHAHPAPQPEPAPAQPEQPPHHQGPQVPPPRPEPTRGPGDA